MSRQLVTQHSKMTIGVTGIIGVCNNSESCAMEIVKRLEAELHSKVI